MEHSKNFEKVKGYFENFLNHLKPAWNEEMVRNAEGKWLAPWEVEEILEGGVNGDRPVE